MADDGDDGLTLGLGLGLSLGGRRGNASRETAPPPQNVPFSSGYSMQTISNAKRGCWADLFRSRIEGNEATMQLRGLDINPVPRLTIFNADEFCISSSNSISSTSGKRSEREHVGDEADAEPECSRGSDDEGAAGSDRSRKKLRLSKDQSLLLEDTFKEHSTLNPKQKLALAKQLNLKPRQVEVWFQNRRARTKLKQTEVDCDYLKKCCERLGEENRRLQKEAQELRALKLSSQVYMHMNPPTTLTMCPSCERIAVSSAASSSSAKEPKKAAECLPRTTNGLATWPSLPVSFSPF